MRAVRFYGANDVGLPEAWPSECRVGVEVLPAGFDALMSEEEYREHCSALQSSVDLWRAAQPAPAPAPSPRTQDTDLILQRLTDQERLALFTARRDNALVDYLVTRAASTGRISESDPDFPTARAMLDQAGIIAAARWEELLAP